MCRLSWNLGPSASWNPQGLSRHVMGLLYLYLYSFMLDSESTPGPYCGRKDYVNEKFQWVGLVSRADNLTTFVCRWSWNLGASTSWKPQGLSRPVMGLLHIFFTNMYTNQDQISTFLAPATNTWSEIPHFTRNLGNARRQIWQAPSHKCHKAIRAGRQRHGVYTRCEKI